MLGVYFFLQVIVQFECVATVNICLAPKKGKNLNKILIILFSFSNDNG